MKRARIILSILSCALILTVFLGSQQIVGANGIPATNVALNAEVTLHGGAFFEIYIPPGPPPIPPIPPPGPPPPIIIGSTTYSMVVSKETIVDGVFLPRGNPWREGPVWWDCHDLVERYITIDLNNVYFIESLIVQADDNDAYFLYYWDLTIEDWELAWHVPNYDEYGWGMQTRPNPDDDTEKYTLPEPIVTNAFKFEGDMSSGDRYFAVSEIQVYGRPFAATIDFKPDTLNLRSKGKWVTVYIELPVGFDVADIQISTIKLNSIVLAESQPTDIGDYDDDDIPDLMVKFDRSAVQALLESGENIEITITGTLNDGTFFGGTDYIRAF